VLLFTLLISLSFPIGSALTAVLDPLVVTWARYLLASLIFVGVLGYQGGLVQPSLRDLGRYTLISLPALCYFVAMFVALQETSALDASALYTTVPLISALAGMVILRRAIGWGMGLALLGGMVAAALIIFRGDLGLVANLSLTPGNRIYLLGCVGLGLGYLALFATALSFLLFQQGSVALQPEQVSAYTYLIPVMVLLTGMLTGETVHWEQVGWGVGGVLLTMVVMVLLPLHAGKRGAV